MTLIRPEVTALIWRWREVIWAVAVAGIGLRLVALGGYFLVPVGLIVAGIGLVLAVTAFRRMQFQQAVDAPGVVEVDEAQVGYLGPELGGFLSLTELVELRILSLRGRRVWRLKQDDGQALLIPVDAKGADRLFDAFANLPGMDTGALVAALAPSSLPKAAALTLAAETRVIWRRQGKGVVRG